MSATANIKLVGTSSLVEADTSTDKAAWFEARAAAINGLGIYSLSQSTGSIAATLAANAAVFSMRWTNPSSYCLIKRISMNVLVLTSVTAAVRSNWVVRGLREFTAPDSAGTAISVATTPNDQKLRTSMPPSQFQLTDLRISSTATLTAGTRIRDANMLGYVDGNIAAASGTGYWVLNPGATTVSGVGGAGLYPILDRTGVGDYPLILGRYEGVAIENELTGPATGTFAVVIQVEWQEVPIY